MTDTTAEPEFDDSGDGLALLFLFIVPALLVVLGIVFMAALGAWWSVGVIFAGLLALAGVVVVGLEAFIGEQPQATGPRAEEDAAWASAHVRQPEPRPRRHHHRLALHH